MVIEKAFPGIGDSEDYDNFLEEKGIYSSGIYYKLPEDL